MQIIWYRNQYFNILRISIIDFLFSILIFIQMSSLKTIISLINELSEEDKESLHDYLLIDKHDIRRYEAYFHPPYLVDPISRYVNARNKDSAFKKFLFLEDNFKNIKLKPYLNFESNKVHCKICNKIIFEEYIQAVMQICSGNIFHEHDYNASEEEILEHLKLNTIIKECSLEGNIKF
jgi:hypothetical protein